MSSGTRKQYTAQFESDAVDLIEREGYSVSEAARRLGVDRSCVDRWRRERRQGGRQRSEPAGSGESAEAEVRRLREEVRKLRMKKEILKNPPMAHALPRGEKLVGGGQAPMASAYAR